MEATHTIITNYILGDIHLRTIQKNILRNTTIFFLYHTKSQDKNIYSKHSCKSIFKYGGKCCTVSFTIHEVCEYEMT